MKARERITIEISSAEIKFLIVSLEWNDVNRKKVLLGVMRV